MKIIDSPYMTFYQREIAKERRIKFRAFLFGVSVGLAVGSAIWFPVALRILK